MAAIVSWMSPSPAASTRPAVTPRSPALDFARVPRRWLFGNASATHVANAVNLLFPAGERMFVRAVRRYADGLEPALAAQVKGFYGQEGRHAQAHERFFEAMRAQGYAIDDFLDWYEHIAYDVLEKASPASLRLAVTVALEHFTAILAEDALAGDMLELADPAMRQLLSWHAVEELEHKAVAFDVLAAKHPGYPLRMAGLFVASSMLAFFWLAAAKELCAQDGMTLGDAARGLRELREKAGEVGRARGTEPIAVRVFWRGIKEFSRPGFHPNDRDHRALVEAALRRLAGEGVVAHP
jgi:predicted metal-dependent hydrolase